MNDPLLSRAFVLAFLANAFHSLGFFGYLHLPGFLVDRGADELMIGLVVGAMAISAVAVRPALGTFIDVRGRRSIIRIGSVLHVIATVSYLGIDEVGPLLFGLRIVHGIAEAMLFTGLFTIAADVVPLHRRTEGLALFGTSGLLPMSIAGLAGDAILAQAGYTELFFAAAMMAGFGGLFSWMLDETRPPTMIGAPPRRSFARVVAQRSLGPLWLMGFSFAVAMASYFTFLKTYVEWSGVGSMGLFYTVYSVVAIVLRIGFGGLPDRYGARRVLVPAIFMTAAGLGMLATATHEVHIGLAGLLCGTGHAFVFPILSALVVTRAADDERGVVLSMFTAMFDLGLLVGAPLLGAILEQTDYRVMFSAAAWVAVVGGLSYLGWDRRIMSRT